MTLKRYRHTYLANVSISVSQQNLALPNSTNKWHLIRLLATDTELSS